MMTKESLAALLNGRDYREEIETIEAKQAKEAGLVVVFGASDDLVEFRGAIYDEAGAYDGGKVVVFEHAGMLAVVDVDAIEDLEGARKQVAAMDSQEAGNVITAVWGPKEPDASWLMKTDLPHASFDIMEDGDLYCRGLVFAIADLKRAA